MPEFLSEHEMPQFLPSGSGSAGSRTSAPEGAFALSDYAAADSASADKAAPEAPALPPLPPRSCRLDDGRVVTLRPTNAFHDFKMRELWARENITVPADALGSMILYAVCALDRIDGQVYMLPHNRADIEGRLQLLSTGQSMTVAAKYMEVEGLLAAGDQFRPAAVASQS